MSLCTIRVMAYGTAKLAEGADVVSRRVLIIDDVITTGAQVVTSGAHLRERGAIVDTVLSVVDRSGDRSALDAGGISIKALFSCGELG